MNDRFIFMLVQESGTSCFVILYLHTQKERAVIYDRKF